MFGDRRPKAASTEKPTTQEVPTQKPAQEMKSLSPEIFATQCIGKVLFLQNKFNQTMIRIKDALLQGRDIKDLLIPRSPADVVANPLAIFWKIDLALTGEVQSLAEETVRRIRAIMEKEEPIAPRKDELFSSREDIQRIKETPKEKRAERVARIKRELREAQRQRIETEKILVRTIRKNPDTSLDDLFLILVKESEKRLLDREFLSGSIQVLHAYRRKHEAVKQYREQYPNDDDLFQILTGRAPRGKIKIITGPMTFMIQCTSIEDYAFFVDGTFLGDHTDNPSPQSPSHTARQSAGIALNSARQDELKGTLVAEKVEEISKKPTKHSLSVLGHEEEHAVQRLISDVLWYRKSMYGPEKHDDEWDGPDEWDESRYKTFLKKARIEDEESAKREILAYTVGKELTIEQVYSALTRKAKDGGLYDYFEGQMGPIKDTIQPQDERERMEKKTYHDIYRRNILAGFHAITQLREHGYGVEDIKILLRYEPLAKWQKVVRRFLERPKS